MVDMNMLKQLGNLKKIQKEISRQTVSVEEKGVRVTVNGQQEIKSLDFDDQVKPETVAKVINQAFDKLKKQLTRNLMRG